MRLERHDEPAVPRPRPARPSASPRARWGGGRSRRRPARRRRSPLRLEPPPRAREVAQTPAQRIGEREAELERRRQRGRRVERVVAAGHPQRDARRAPPARAPRPSERSGPATSRSVDAQIGALAVAVGPHAPPLGRARSRQGRAPGRRAQTTTRPPRRDQSTNASKAVVHGLRGAVVVEVVGLDVGHDRDVGVYPGTSRRSRRPRRRTASPLPSWALAPASFRSPPIANDGSAPHVLQGDGEHRRGRGLAVRAGDRDARGGPAISAASACDRWMHAQPRAPRRDQLGVGLADRRRHDHGVGARHVLGVVADVDLGAERPQGRQVRESLASLPLTGMPRASRIRAMPDMPGAADADEVHPAQLLGRRDGPARRRAHAGLRRAAGAGATDVEHQVGEPLVGVALAAASGGLRPWRAAARRRAASGARVAATHSGVQSRVVDQQPAARRRRPAAALSRCSPLPIGSGT